MIAAWKRQAGEGLACVLRSAWALGSGCGRRWWARWSVFHDVYMGRLARRVDLNFYGAVPRPYGQFLAHVPYHREVIVRRSAIFVLDARTLGFHVEAVIQDLHLDVAAVLIVVTGGLSMLIDAASCALRVVRRTCLQPTRARPRPGGACVRASAISAGEAMLLG